MTVPAALSVPANEAGRLVILDSPFDHGFDDITLLANLICAVPTAPVNLTVRERQ